MALAVVASIFLLACTLLYFKKFSNNQWKFPPSPKSALPFLGHLHLLGKHPQQSLTRLAHQMKQGNGFMYLKLGTIHTIVATSPDAAKSVLKTNDHIFASRPQTMASKYFGYDGKGLGWAPLGEHFTRVKKLCITEILSSKRVEMFKPLRRLEMSVLVKELFEFSQGPGSNRIGNQVVNMSREISNVMFNILTRAVINKSFSAAAKDDKERNAALKFRDDFVEAAGLSGTRPLIGDFFPALKWMDTQVSQMAKVQAKLDSYIQSEVKEHKCNWKPGSVPKDFMDVMLSLETISETSMKALAVDMLAAGTETGGTSMEWGLAELIKNPGVLKKLQQELDEVIGKDRTLEEEDIPKLKYLQATVKEILRLHPPTPLCLPHESIEACTIGDYVVPPKTRAIVNLYGIFRDPKLWEQPLEFRPERFLAGDKANIDIRGSNFEMMPFGSGRRMCPGSVLGSTMLHYLLGTMVHAFEWQGYEPGELDMEEAVGLAVQRANPLMLVPKPRLAEKAYYGTA